MGKLIVDDITRNVYCVSTSLTDNSTINDSTSFASKNIINTSTNFNQGGFTVAAGGINPPVPGIYLICFNCYMNSTADRENVLVSVSIDGENSTYSAHGYIRDYDGHQHSSVGGTQISYLQPDQQVNLEFRREADVGTVELIGANSHIAMAKID